MKKSFTVLSIASFFITLVIIVTVSWIDRVFRIELPFAAFVHTLMLPINLDHVDPSITASFYRRIILIVSVMGVYCAILFLLYRLKKPKILSGLLFINFLLFTGTIIYVQYTFSVVQYFMSSSETTTMYDDHYVAVNPQDIIFPDPKKNVILLVMESTENTFNNEDIFGEKLMPKLWSLQQKYPAFFDQLPSSRDGWTFAALVNYLFGMPLSSPVPGNKNILGAILPGAVSLLEVFEQNGYEVDFVLGSSGNFAGMNIMFSSHLKSPNIYDRWYFEKHDPKAVAARRENKVTKWGWGLPDSYFYNWLKSHLSEKDPNQPFFMVAMTINSHAPGEFEQTIPARYNDYRDVVAEADTMAGEFIDWVMAQEFAENTTIIIAGDHPVMTNDIGPFNLDGYSERHPLNVFINAPEYLGRPEMRRQFASFDLAPTIIESAGATLPNRRFGLGVSLFAIDQKTLFEDKGLDYYNEEVGKSSALYERFLLGQ